MSAPVDPTPDEVRARALLTAARMADACGDQLEASRLFRRAGNFFKLDQQWHAAGAAFQTAAGLKLPFEVEANTDPYLTTGARQITAADLLKTASDCFVKAKDTGAAVTCLQTAADLLTEDGDFTTAAGYCTEVGNMLAPRDADAGIRYYEKAARLREAAADVFGRKAADTAWMTVGEWLARKGAYIAAIDLFEGLADRIIREPSAEDYASKHGIYVEGATKPERQCVFRAVLCYLCRDGPSAAQAAVARWDAKLPSSGSFDQERNVLRQAMGGAENRFTADSIAKILQAPENTTDSYPGSFGPPAHRLDEWTRMMLGRALQMLRDAEYQAQR
ncbi:alpha-soluble NSF attachment protein-like [Paramacrobiotus metropolitanus]|uniref:alpha-soluble NSF attachment protein-like n=1 Tax=Paramacrobiotus metropolitanus TaxID=2943436 RepID=UPI0024459988|nr:alpha-soluble NSF attachment protein-like [Paramacrobiotus metropolitanus]